MWRALIDDLSALGTSDPAPHLPNDIEAHTRFRIAWGWYQEVRRWTQASMVLTDSGLGYEAAPIRRSMIEHVVALEWMSQAGQSALDAINDAHRYRLEKMYEVAVAERIEVPPFEDLPVARHEPTRSPESSMVTFTQAVKKYGDPRRTSGTRTGTS